MKKIIYIILISLIFSNCSKKLTEPIDPNAVTIGTFNVEWLGDGVRDRKPRTENDYKMLAEIISKTGVDIMGLQEVENVLALKKVLKYLDGYSYVISNDGGPQKIAVIYKNYLDVKSLGEYKSLEIEKGRTRPGLLLKVKDKNFDWLMMVVHLKSTSHYDVAENSEDESRDIREKQAFKLSNWVDSTMKYGNEKDLIIVGDFNDAPKRQKNNTLVPLLSNSMISFLTYDLRSCKYKNGYSIDQIIVSQPAKWRFIKNSLNMIDFYSYLSVDQATLISDHCPVFAKFNITEPDKYKIQDLSKK